MSVFRPTLRHREKYMKTEQKQNQQWQGMREDLKIGKTKVYGNKHQHKNGKTKITWHFTAVKYGFFSFG